ncbi:histone H2B-like [Heptranchias perlo]|uniref:histone H2B-like n=1 Tax=Heptranchias perlo TaxID=212740 RepID=UPI003559D3FC
MKSVAPVVKHQQSAELRKATKMTSFKRKTSYSTYIYRVLKQVHPDHGHSMEFVPMNSSPLFDQIAAEAARLSLYNKRSTITSQEVRNALRHILSGGLANAK